MERKWWKESVVYQIYPRSFMDSNGDGIGDLQGIITKLDYLQELGVDVIWLSPVYKSPNDDNGYDISDYQDIMDEFGTMEDWEELLYQIHRRGLKLIMDLVVNHSSDEHPWFIESKSSLDNPKRDYYIWRAGNNGKEPNNWASCFSGSAWKYDEKTAEYYLHIFTAKQPDLNWETPQLRQDIYNMMTWWLEKGVDGFRMDVVNFISKTDGLPNAPKENENQYHWGGRYFINGPCIHEILQEMNSKVLSRYDIMTVGEMPDVTPKEAALYTGLDRNELHMVFQFEHMELDAGPGGKWDFKPWKLRDLKTVMSKWQTELEGVGWNSLYLNNHDQPRMVSRFGNDTTYRVESAKMLATFLHMLQGTPYIYQGEEIGMTNTRMDSIADYKDVETLNMYNDKVVRNGEDVTKVMQCIYKKSRDNARTPFQWDDSEHAGFTIGTPWIAVNDNYREINAQRALKEPQSVFNYYKQLISLRKKNEIIVYGIYELLIEEHEQIYAFIRTLGEDRLVVILNFFGNTQIFELPTHISYGTAELMISNYESDPTEDIKYIILKPYEARVYRLK